MSGLDILRHAASGRAFPNATAKSHFVSRPESTRRSVEGQEPAALMDAVDAVGGAGIGVVPTDQRIFVDGFGLYHALVVDTFSLRCKAATAFGGG